MCRKVSLVFVFCFALSLPIYCADFLRPDGTIDAVSLNEYLVSENAGWTAAENDFTRMSKEQRKTFATMILPEEPLPEPKLRGLERIMTFDPVFDWRSRNGQDFTTPIKNQGYCGSCWAFAVCAVAEAMINVAENSPNLDINLSEQYLVSTCCSEGDCDGGYLYYTFEFLDAEGLPLEACYPYIAANSDCSARCADWLSEMRSFGSAFWLPNAASAVQIKTALLSGPVAAAMEVYEDFYSYGGGVYRHLWGGFEGYHAIAIVGWNDADSCWICKNSWGTSWGENGWFKIKWFNCTINDWVCGTEYAPLSVIAGTDTTITLNTSAILSGSASNGSPNRSDPIGYTASWQPSGGITNPTQFVTLANPTISTKFALQGSDLNLGKVDTVHITVVALFAVESEYGTPSPANGALLEIGAQVLAYVDSMVEVDPGRFARCIGYNIRGADSLCGEEYSVNFTPTGYDTIVWLWEELLCVKSAKGTDSACLMASPNPCAPMARITYSLAERTNVLLTIHDLAGRIVVELSDNEQDAGEHEFYWDGTDLHGYDVPAGTYFAVLNIDNRWQSVKVVLIR